MPHVKPTHVSHHTNAPFTPQCLPFLMLSINAVTSACPRKLLRKRSYTSVDVKISCPPCVTRIPVSTVLLLHAGATQVVGLQQQTLLTPHSSDSSSSSPSRNSQTRGGEARGGGDGGVTVVKKWAMHHQMLCLPPLTSENSDQV